MAKSTVAELPAKIYALLEPLTTEERGRVIKATMVLFGEESPITGSDADNPAPPGGAAGSMSPPRGSGNSDPQAFFDEKAPKNKVETLAVAARFREQVDGIESHSKADLKKVITDARRNFDDHNFSRDLDNAKRSSGFFNIGTGRDASKLSYYGQQFVDTLPDREAAEKLKKPKVRATRKKKTKKKSTAKK